MNKLALVLSLICAAGVSAQAPSRTGHRVLGKAGESRHDRPRRLGHSAVYGKTDADVVSGLMNAQAEDDFNRVETNYINSMGRLAEAEGEGRSVPGSADEIVHQPRFHEGQVRGEPGVAQDPDDRLRRRLKLLLV